MTNKMTKTVTDANTTKLNNLIFYPLEAVSCLIEIVNMQVIWTFLGYGSETQLTVGKHLNAID